MLVKRIHGAWNAQPLGGNKIHKIILLCKGNIGGKEHAGVPEQVSVAGEA